MSETWFQQIDLGNGEISPGLCTKEALMTRLGPAMPDFEDKRVLEMGCAEGFFSFYAEEQGAAEIRGFDWLENNIARAKYAAERRNSKVDFFVAEAEGFKPSRQYDLILCLGLIYHLENPIAFLRKISGMLLPGCQAVIETALLDGSQGVPEREIMDYENTFPVARLWRGDECNGDATNWWTPNEACMLAMFDRTGLQVVKGGKVKAVGTEDWRGFWLVKPNVIQPY